MSQILVWKSDTDGKLFEDKKKYQTHLRKLAGARAVQRSVDAMEAKREQFVIGMGNSVKSIKELEQFIKDNWKWFAANASSQNSWRGVPGSTEHKLVRVSIEAKWSDYVSNSHRCPRGGMTNWDQRNAKPGTPTGYPGWRGQIRFTIDAGQTDHKVPRKRDGFGGDYFDRTGVNTGSGGSSDGRNYSYSLELFASDFPAMLKEREKAIVWSTLGGRGIGVDEMINT